MPELLGIHSVVAEDTVRRFLKAIDEAPGMNWLQAHLDTCVAPLLSILLEDQSYDRKLCMT